MAQERSEITPFTQITSRSRVFEMTAPAAPGIAEGAHGWL
jgi:hypothetical protein